MVFLNFLNFFTIFLEFSITRRVGTERNNNFYFLSFSALSNLFWVEMTPYWFYDYFLTFFAISLEFSIARRVGTERNDNFYFLFLSIFVPILAWNVVIMVFFLFFLLFFWNFVLQMWLERNGTIIFILSLSPPFATYFGLKWSHNGIF